jgi:hypothetical protein
VQTAFSPRRSRRPPPPAAVVARGAGGVLSTPIAPADRAKLQALENAGADAAVMLLASQPEEALAELEQVTQQVL